MTGLPAAHIGGIPIEETLGFFGPALLLVAGAASARLSARVRHLRPGTLIRRLVVQFRPQSGRVTGPAAGPQTLSTRDAS